MVKLRFTSFYGNPDQNLKDALNDHELNDLGFMGPRYTWTNKRQGLDQICERLNYFVTDNLWLGSFLNSSVSHLDFYGSDHKPILLIPEVMHEKKWVRSGGNWFSFNINGSGRKVLGYGFQQSPTAFWEVVCFTVGDPLVGPIPSTIVISTRGVKARCG
ncbi:hypothetical protein ACS0TY_011319 [Phlomoides rotata]